MRLTEICKVIHTDQLSVFFLAFLKSVRPYLPVQLTNVIGNQLPYA